MIKLENDNEQKVEKQLLIQFPGPYANGVRVHHVV